MVTLRSLSKCHSPLTLLLQRGELMFYLSENSRPSQRSYNP
jgi:hypothetical protein